MGLKPHDRTIGDVFKNKEYAIDFYQREYKWNDKKQEHKPVKSLIDDIFYRFDLEYKPNLNLTRENISGYEWYYLSTFLTNEIDGRIFIVDGQQRLTTLTLIIIKLYHSFVAAGLDDDYLKNTICGPSMYGKVFWLGFDDRRNAIEDIFANDIEFKKKPSNLSEKNIYENYGYIYGTLKKRLESVHKLQAFVMYFFERIYMIEIAIDKPKDVAMVFEVINDRGVALKAYEILKGKLLGQINKSDVSNYIKIWDNNIERIEDCVEEEVDNFFSAYFRSKYAESSEHYKKLEEDKYHRTIFLEDWNKKIKLKQNENKVKIFIENDLGYFTEVYTDILKYYLEYSSGYEHVYFNRLNSQNSQFLLILSAIGLNDPQRDEKIKLVSRLFDRNYSILNLTGSYKSNAFNESMIKLSHMIREKSLDAINEAFEQQLLDDIRKIKARNDIKKPLRYDFFSPLGYSDFAKNFLRYFYARVEHFIAVNSGLSCGSYYQLVSQGKGKDVHHIEHILSNNMHNEELFKDEEEFNFHRNRLGGLVLLKGPDNQSSGAEVYLNKLKTYSGNGTLFAQTLRKDFYKSNKGFEKFRKKFGFDFTAYSKFDKNAVEERQRLLFDIAKMIW